MTDARISTGLPAHPKTRKLMRRLGPAGPWALVCLFLWARDNRPDGDLSGLSDEDIELAANWDGDEGALVAALVEVRFVDGEEGSRAVHDWVDHQPWSAGSESRSERARWRALIKHHGREEAAALMPEYAARLAAAPREQDEGIDGAQGKHAAGLLVAESSMLVPAARSAPSPSPSPSPRSKDDSLPGIVSTPAATETDPPDPGAEEPEQDLLGVVPPPRRKRETPPCPGQKIADLWDAILLPEAASISQWNDRRARVVGARWKEQAEVEGWKTQEEGLAWFETIFKACRSSKFLMGKVPARPGQLQFKLKFDWFFGAENFIRIIEGDFHRGR